MDWGKQEQTVSILSSKLLFQLSFCISKVVITSFSLEENWGVGQSFFAQTYRLGYFPKVIASYKNGK